MEHKFWYFGLYSERVDLIAIVIILFCEICFTAKLWDARYGEVVHTFDHEHIVKSVNFNSDDTLLLTASNEKLIRVYDLNKPEAGGEVDFIFIITSCNRLK